MNPWQLLLFVVDIGPLVLRWGRRGISRAKQYVAARALRKLRVEESEVDITYLSNCSRRVAELVRAEFETAGWPVHCPAVPLGDRHPYLDVIQIKGWSPPLVASVAHVVASLTGQRVATELMDGSAMHEDNPKWATRDAKVFITIGYLHHRD